MASSAELQFQFGQLSPALHLIETEDSWQKIDGALSRLETITKSGAYKNDAFVPLIKEYSAPIVNSLLSERTKLSGSAADLLTSVAPRLANRFEPLISTFVPPLLQLCARTNKVALIRAKKCLLLIAKHCKLASLLPLLRDAARDKSITLRNVSVEVTLMLVESIENLERLERRVGDIEIIIKSTATDRDPEVRQWSKRMFELYGERFPYRMEEFTAPLTPTTRRYLALKNTDRQAGPSTFSVKPMPRNPVEQQRPRASPEKVIRAVSASTNKPTSHTTVKRQRDASASARSASGPQGKPTSRSVSSSSKSAQNTPSSDKETRMQEVPPPVPVIPKVDPTEERERAILKAEVARMTSATPSRGIAARLALEQFEIKVRAKSGADGLKAGSSSRAALTAFAVAASKKHSSPKRMPARVPLPPQPTEDRKSTKVETKNVVMPQRVVRSPIEPVSIPPSPDVFGSRPMPKEAIQRNKVPIATASSKRASTLTKNMGARGMLLGNATPSTTTKQRAKPQVKTSIPIASPRPKFFASPPLTKKQNREEELNQLGDIMEALSVTVAQEDENKENVPDVVMNIKKDNTPPIPERRNSSDSKRRSCELEPLQTINGTEDAKRMKMQSPSSIIQSRPVLSPRSTSRKAVRPAFHFGRMAPLVISGKKI